MKKKKALSHKQVSTLGGMAHGKPHFQKMLMARWHPKEYAKLYGKKVAKVKR